MQNRHNLEFSENGECQHNVFADVILNIESGWSGHESYYSSRLNRTICLLRMMVVMAEAAAEVSGRE